VSGPAAADLTPSPKEPGPTTTVQAPPRPWGFWATSGWVLLTLGSVLSLGPAITIWVQSSPLGLSLWVNHNRAFLILLAIGPAVIFVGISVLAARLARWPVAEYLGLVRPRERDVVLGAACIIVYMAATLTLISLLGAEWTDAVARRTIDAYRDARADGSLPLLWLVTVVLAPVGEETLYRGFVFRGWAQSRMGVMGTILLTSVIFALMHHQYNLVVLLFVLCMGLILGWLRWRSGSTTLTILLHALANSIGCFVAAIYVGWSS